MRAGPLRFEAIVGPLDLAPVLDGDFDGVFDVGQHLDVDLGGARQEHAHVGAVAKQGLGERFRHPREVGAPDEREQLGRDESDLHASSGFT